MLKGDISVMMICGGRNISQHYEPIIGEIEEAGDGCSGGRGVPAKVMSW